MKAAVVALALAGCTYQTEPWTWERVVAVLIGALVPVMLVVLLIKLHDRWRKK